MSIATKRVYQIYLQFQTLGGALRCKLFNDAFPQLSADDSFEYEEMKAGYKPEEFATSYLRPEVLESEMSNTYKRKEYEQLSVYLQDSLK